MVACLLSKSPSSIICRFRFPFLLYYSSTTSSTVNDYTVYDFLCHKHDFSSQTASGIASVLKSLKTPQNSDSIILFLKQNGFSKTHLERIFRCIPRLLSAQLEKDIKPKIKFFQDLGFSSSEIAMTISNDPQVLQCSIDDKIIPSLNVLKGLFQSNLELVKVLRSHRRVLSVDLNNVLVPNVEFLKSSGIPLNQILKQLLMAPWMFTLKPENVRKYVEKADEMGVHRSSAMFMYAVRVLSSMSNDSLDHKLKTLRDLGFSEVDLLKLFRTAPLVLSASVDKIKKASEVLLETGKYDISSIVSDPTSLMYSVEKRYKPRIQILKDLEKRNLIKKWPSLVALHVMPDDKFFKRFVAPYLDDDVGEAIIAYNAVTGKRETEISQKDAN